MEHSTDDVVRLLPGGITLYNLYSTMIEQQISEWTLNADLHRLKNRPFPTFFGSVIDSFLYQGMPPGEKKIPLNP